MFLVASYLFVVFPRFFQIFASKSLPKIKKIQTPVNFCAFLTQKFGRTPYNLIKTNYDKTKLDPGFPKRFLVLFSVFSWVCPSETLRNLEPERNLVFSYMHGCTPARKTKEKHGKPWIAVCLWFCLLFEVSELFAGRKQSKTWKNITQTSYA